MRKCRVWCPDSPSFSMGHVANIQMGQHTDARWGHVAVAYHVRRGEGREPSCDLISRSSKNRSGREPRQREQGKPNTRVERFKAVNM
eukprot:scaffold20316_cov66-Phaeocystis_antarctica.AAC.6